MQYRQLKHINFQKTILVSKKVHKATLSLSSISNRVMNRNESNLPIAKGGRGRKAVNRTPDTYHSL
jgi:hypothetical protein